MIINCWGSRGSIPVSGPAYIRYGGDTTCLEIRARSGDLIIVDAGTGIRRLGLKLMAEQRRDCHFIFTHAHWDHVMGFPFFRPIFVPKARFFMHRCPFESKFVETILTKVMSPPTFPVRYRDIDAQILYQEACPAPFTIGSIRIDPFPISHPNAGVGYKFTENGKSFVFLTDNELDYRHPDGKTPDEYADFCRESDLLIHDAEYTPAEYPETRSWGHSRYTDALELALKAGAAQLGLFHHNQDRTDDQVDEIVDDCRRRIATAGDGLKCFAVGTDMSFTL